MLRIPLFSLALILLLSPLHAQHSTAGTKKKVLMIVANPAISKTTGWPIGFWAAELTHPYLEFVEAGYEVTIASPRGGKVAIDGYSDPADASGYSADDLISWGFLANPATKKLLDATPKLSSLKPADYDALFVCGGQSPMYTFIENDTLHRFVASFYETGRPLAVVCHGTCILLKTRLRSGKLLVEGKTWTGFANSEEDFADKFVNKRIQPFRIEDEARKIPGTNFIVSGMFAHFAVRDGNLITGQQQFSGKPAAQLLVQALGK